MLSAVIAGKNKSQREYSLKYQDVFDAMYKYMYWWKIQLWNSNSLNVDAGVNS